jgi:hypothetical protein
MTKPMSRIRVGDIYEDCGYRPCVAIKCSIREDVFEGVSLINGNVTCCSYRHCGVNKMTIRQAAIRRVHWKEFHEFLRRHNPPETDPERIEQYKQLLCVTSWTFVCMNLTKFGFEYKLALLSRAILWAKYDKAVLPIMLQLLEEEYQKPDQGVDEHAQ